MAKYKVRLNKTKMYQLASGYDLDLPKMSDCKFSHMGTCYWLDYIPLDDSFYSIRVTVHTCGGDTYIRFVGLDCGEPDQEILVGTVSFDYLMEQGLLQEVA